METVIEEKTYLELSEDAGSSHKFYEVIIYNTKVSIRFGRIGDTGRTQVSNYASYSLARKFADKKISEKLKKGYEYSVIGQRQKRSVTRRIISSNQSSENKLRFSGNLRLVVQHSVFMLIIKPVGLEIKLEIFFV
jgi:predicted DNA-binding WGR domain protein